MDLAKLQAQLGEVLEPRPDAVAGASVVLGGLLHSKPEGRDLASIRFELRAALSELRSELGEGWSDQLGGGDEARAFCHGALHAFAELTAGYHMRSRALEEFANDPDQLLRDRVLAVVVHEPNRPSAIARATGATLPQISRALGDLRSDGLIELVDDVEVSDGRARWYRPTAVGEARAQHIAVPHAITRADSVGV